MIKMRRQVKAKETSKHQLKIEDSVKLYTLACSMYYFILKR